MITNFFKKATPVDIEEQKKRDAMYWAKRKEEEAEKLARDEEWRVAVQKAKRSVGRPKMKCQPNVVLISPVEEVEVEESVATQPPTKKSRCCCNPTLAKCEDETHTSQSWGFGVLRDSRIFRVRQKGEKHLALGRSWCHWKGLEV